jgi:ubiquinone/menaquinone biosynthesis C-methylase UbiE
MGQSPHDEDLQPPVPFRREPTRRKERIMGIGRRFFAATYDRQTRKLERYGLAAVREELIAKATGDVLEVGGGTGANLDYYQAATIRSLAVTDPDPSMLRRLERKAAAADIDAMVLRAPAEDLPFEDDSFDAVVSTLVFCGVDDQPRAAREIHRVLRSDGRLIFVEHVRSADPAWARSQDRMNWLNRIVVHCDCNRPTLDTLRSCGFDIESVRDWEMPKVPKFVQPAVIGVATPRR